MNDERFDELMRDAAASYNRPPEPPLDEMWSSIETEHFGALPRNTVRPIWQRGWVRIAATLVLGIALGRASMSIGKSEMQPLLPPAMVAVEPSSSVRTDTVLAEPYQTATSKYLGQAAALLISLPSEVKSGRTDAQFINRAGELLTTTRLLLDSPAAADQDTRNLLEDLELVLAQVVHLRNNRSRTELDLINQALEQRDVLPRLRSAVTNISADN